MSKFNLMDTLGLDPISRRGFLAALGATAVSGQAQAEAPPVEPAKVMQTWTSPDNCYFAYPHANGFISDRKLIITQQVPEKRALRYLAWDFLDGAVEELFETDEGVMYGDYCEATESFYYVEGRRRLIERRIGKGERPRVLLEPAFEPDEKMEGLVSVDPPGRKVLWAIESIDGAREVRSARLMETELSTGKTPELAPVSFNADHQHYCPGDPRWIGFSHEGDIHRSLDRMWALHLDDRGATVSKIWDETDARGTGMLAGHERWAFHTAGAVVVAYGGAGMSGLYFVDAPSRKGKLISPSRHDWHCNISRDGRLAVVDTKPRPQPDGRQLATIEWVDMLTGARKTLASAHVKDHPWHPHPHISPSGRFVVFNDFMAAGFGAPSCVKVVRVS